MTDEKEIKLLPEEENQSAGHDPGEEHHHSSGEHHHHHHSSEEHHHSSGEHHHHHHSGEEHHHSSGEHHHHSDGEHHHSSEEHNHHSSGEHHHSSEESHSSGKKHHHHHHHHHHHSSKRVSKKRKWHWRGIRKSMKRMFLKIFSIEKNKHETDKQRLLKRSIFLLFLIVISTFAFYMLLLDNMNGEDLSRARNSSSEITQLQKRITNLEKELKMYKEIYGELDLSNINK